MANGISRGYIMLLRFEWDLSLGFEWDFGGWALHGAARYDLGWFSRGGTYYYMVWV